MSGAIITTIEKPEPKFKVKCSICGKYNRESDIEFHSFRCSLITLDRKFNILEFHPKLITQILLKFDKYKPNRVGHSELKEAGWKRNVGIAKKKGIDISIEHYKLLFSISRGTSQKYGNDFQNIYASADGWENLKIGNLTKCDLKNDSKKIVLELKSHNDTTTFKHQDIEKKNGFKWAKDHGYQYIYGIIDVSGTDETYTGIDTIDKEGIRTCTKQKLAKVIFGYEKAYDFIIESYKLGSNFIESF